MPEPGRYGQQVVVLKELADSLFILRRLLFLFRHALRQRQFGLPGIIVPLVFSQANGSHEFLLRHLDELFGRERQQRNLLQEENVVFASDCDVLRECRQLRLQPRPKLLERVNYTARVHCDAERL